MLLWTCRARSPDELPLPITRTHLMATPLAAATRLGGWYVALGMIGGVALGAVARVWMRFISDNHEFTWAGTLGVVIGLALFATLQALVAVAVARNWRTWLRRTTRVAAVIGLLPLFPAAGAMMAPAVVFAGLAWWNPRWHVLVRLLFAGIAAIDVVLVSRTITDDFGWSVRGCLGVAWMLGIYASIVWCAEGTFRVARGRTRSPSGRPAVCRSG
ncbi:MAG: hypothetical protein Q7V57_15720 [Actinomycetota bacterium]|nr:hypothetical protein [Actinomycetota bacterium]